MCDEAVPLNWSSQQPMCRLSASVRDAVICWGRDEAQYAARKADVSRFMVMVSFCDL